MRKYVARMSAAISGGGGRESCSRMSLRSSGLHTNAAYMLREAKPLAPPRPVGERSARFARRVRGNRAIERSLPPHPNPLPNGERERAEFAAKLARSPDERSEIRGSDAHFREPPDKSSPHDRSEKTPRARGRTRPAVASTRADLLSCPQPAKRGQNTCPGSCKTTPQS